jgi:hypothetical protein
VCWRERSLMMAYMMGLRASDKMGAGF